MFEQDWMREEFAEVVELKRAAADRLAKILARVEDPALRTQLNELHSQAVRHVELAERLVEIVS